MPVIFFGITGKGGRRDSPIGEGGRCQSTLAILDTHREG